MTSTGFPIEKVVVLLLILLAVVLVVFGFSTMVWPSAKTALGWDVDENLSTSKGGAIDMYSTFLNDYKACKETSDTDCFCQINHFSLPTTFNMELDNKNSETRIRLYLDKELVNKEDEDKSSNLIKNDIMMYPLETPGQTGSFVDDQSTLLTQKYRMIDSALLYYKDTGSAGTGIAMTGIRDGSRLDEFSLYGLYKTSDNINTYMVPSPAQKVGTGSEKCLMKSLTENLRQCSRISSDSKIKIDGQINELKSKIENCKKFPKNNQQCSEIFKITMPEEYSVSLVGNTIQVTDNKIKPQPLSYPIEVQSGSPTSKNIIYLFTNGKWMWTRKQTLGLIADCSCRYYPVNINDPSIECNAEGSLNDWYKEINNNLVKAETYEDSYETGLAVIINSVMLKPSITVFSMAKFSPSIKVIKNEEVTLNKEDFEGNIQDNVIKLREYTTKSTPSKPILMKTDLGAKVCQLKSINPVQVSDKLDVLKTGQYGLYSMLDGSICYYAYSDQEVQNLAKTQAMTKLFK